MSTLGPVQRDLPAPDAEALIREARRHQRRRYAITAGGIAAAAAVLAATLIVLAGGPGGPQGPARRDRPKPAQSAPPSRPGSGIQAITGIRGALLMWQAPGPVAVFSLRDGAQSSYDLAGAGVGDYQPALIKTGRWLVYVGHGTTAIRSDRTGRPRILGTTPFFAPAARPGYVWLVDVGRDRRAPQQARLVSASGAAPGSAVTLPAGRQLVAGTRAGLLLQAPTGRLQLWTPGEAPRPLPYAADWADGFGATARLVAYGTGCRSTSTTPDAPQEPGGAYDICRTLRVLSVVTGRIRSFAAPPGSSGWVPDEFNLVDPIAPGDTMIAARAAIPSPASDQARLYLLRLKGSHLPGRPSETHRLVAVPRSAGFVLANLAWSADGRWLLYQGPGGHLAAYQPASGQVRSSPAACCLYTVMITTTASRYR
jgi:hypothetical protein